MSESIFDQDLKRAKRSLVSEQRWDWVLRVVTLGLRNNRKRIEAATETLRVCQSGATEYQDALRRAAALDTDADAQCSLEGARYSKRSEVDLPTSFGGTYGVVWAVTRAAILDRDGHECQEADGRCDGPLDVHHVVPLSRRGTNAPGNLITLCRRHHSLKHPHMRI